MLAGRLALSRAGILSSWWHGCGEDEATALRRLTTIIAVEAPPAWGLKALDVEPGDCRLFQANLGSQCLLSQVYGEFNSVLSEDSAYNRGMSLLRQPWMMFLTMS